MGLLDMITGQKPKPGQPSGLLGMLGMDPNSTTFNVGAQLLANGLPTTKPFQMGAGIPEAIERSQTMQVRQQAVEQERADREAEAARRQAMAETVVPMMPANLQALAQVDPEGAMAIWKQTQPAAPDYTANQQDYLFAQANPGFADFLGGSEGAPQIVETFDAETGQPVKGYMQGGTFVPVGGPKAPAARDNPMNPTVQKEIFEADEGVQAGQAVIGGLTRALELNDIAYDGPFAEQRSAATALFGDQGGIATQELKNVVTSQALESLKAVFGGMPTEGERKILLEIQGSVDQPKPVREAIYRRAMEAAKRRIAANQAKADGLRTGEYFDPSFGQPASPAQPASAAPVSGSGFQILSVE